MPPKRKFNPIANLVNFITPKLKKWKVVKPRPETTETMGKENEATFAVAYDKGNILSVNEIVYEEDSMSISTDSAESIKEPIPIVTESFPTFAAVIMDASGKKFCTVEPENSMCNQEVCEEGGDQPSSELIDDSDNEAAASPKETTKRVIYALNLEDVKSALQDLTSILKPP
ncbi:hypothetical protein CPB84DRAFT_1754277 [Gymnopilus junonius]|uniref:Uncharacterized protein n=1 Tax=Gymnopilus junonius TaxID=109634 RepID=A0A9P5TFS9_GYMJU|nr:hypothetical protein CPB84DRAFT_1754277 [Gymnopilus junonius]